MLKIFLIVFSIIFFICFFASIVPIAQYIYYRFVKKDDCSIKYYFSEYIFDNHMRHDIGINDVRVINNRKELSKLWEIEMAHDLP